MSGNKLDQYPFPIAYPARLLSIAENPADEIDDAQHFVELTAVTLGVLALGWCQAHAVCPDGVRNWEKKLDPERADDRRLAARGCANADSRDADGRCYRSERRADRLHELARLSWRLTSSAYDLRLFPIELQLLKKGILDATADS